MKTRNVFRRLAAAVLPVLIILAGCDSGDTCDDCNPSPQEQAFKIDCNWSDHAATTVFAATGAIVDAGTVTGDPVPWSTTLDGPEIWVGTRTFHGKAGDLHVYVDAALSDAESSIATGDFVIVRGTDDYVGYQADGEFSLILDGDGRFAEVFEGVLYNGK